jgi:hypothetical protein
MTTERKPIAWVLNKAGEHHHLGGRLVAPRGVWTALFTSEQVAYFKAKPHGQYEVRDGAVLKLDPVPQDAATLEVEPSAEQPPDTTEDLNFVTVHDVDDDPKNATVELASGRVVSVQHAVSILEKAGHAEIARGWITLFPGTEDEQKFHGWAKFIEALREEPGLLMPGEE